MANVRYLIHRSSGFYARIVVPEPLRQIIGKRELSAPLRAASKAEAVRKLPGAVATMQATLDAARAQGKREATRAAPPRKGKPLSTRQMAVAHYDGQMRFDDELRNSDDRYARGFIDERYVEALKRVISGSAANDEIEGTVGSIIAKFQDGGNTKVQTGTPEWRDLARALAGVELESLARQFERDEGDLTGKPSHPMLVEAPRGAPSPADTLSARILSPESTKPLSELLPMLLGERGATPSGDYGREVTVRVLEEHMGEARPVYQITRQDIHSFKRALATAPANYSKRFPNKTLPDAIKANAALKKPFPALSARTINDKYLSGLHAIFNWCVRSDILPDNPAAGIKTEVIKERGKAPRVPFAPSDLTKIFAAPLFDAGKPFGETQWATLVSLFSGMRASELAQIKLDSVRTERGTLVFAIEEETKNAGSQRIVPVHSKLIALGLGKHVENLRLKGGTHLFPDWYQKGMSAKARATRGDGKATLNHYFPRFIPKKFNNWHLPKVGIDDGRKTWHSFRHTFKTGLALAGVAKSIQDELCGHADYSAGAGYVHGMSIEARKEAIERLRFDGFGLGN
jgi:integrase